MYINETHQKGVGMILVINQSIWPGINLRTRPQGCLKAETWLDTRVNDQLSISYIIS